MEIKLGNKVKCTVTGFTGIAVSKVEYLNGCVQYSVEPKVKDNEKKKSEWIDVEQLIVVSKGIFVESVPTGGGFRSHPGE